MLDLLIVTIALATVSLILILILTRGRAAAQARNQARAGWFDACLPLMSDARVGATDHGFARVNGRYRGTLFDLQALPDTLTCRKLPSLWLLVSIPEPMPLSGTLDLMVRPTGGEVFSHFATRPVAVEVPPGFPPDTAVRSDRTDLVLRPDLAARLGAAFFSPRVKELVLSPKGLRLVWLAEEADRSRYLLFRDAETGALPLAPATLLPLLDLLVDLAQTLRMSEAA